MIVTQESNKRVVQSHDFDSVNCTIDAEDMRYVASLLRNNYSNPPLAVVREITANGLDANLEAGSSRQVEVTIPSKLNPHFVVRDFGGGLSQEDVFGLYSKYGKSTKRESNNYIGAFGIGKFAPLSYGNNFTVVSYHGGTKTSYNVFVNEDDDTKIVKLHEEPSQEPTGLSVEVAIADGDVRTFRNVIKQFFQFFPENELPKFVGLGEDEEFFAKHKKLMEGDNWFVVEFARDDNYYNNSRYSAKVLMGRVAYEIDVNAINFDEFCEHDTRYDCEAYRLEQLARQAGLHIHLPIGSVKLHHSREALEYNKSTQKALITAFREVLVDAEKIAKEKLKDAEDLWDAKLLYAQVTNALPQAVRTILQNSFEFKGRKVDSAAFAIGYNDSHDIKVTECVKTSDDSATDGFRIASRVVRSIYVGEDKGLLIQDLHSPHGNALRVRTMMGENSNLETVYVINPLTKTGEDLLWNKLGFKGLKKSRYKFTSNVEKATLQSGTSSRGETRSAVPLFEFDLGGTRYGRRNSDHWLNCESKISELEHDECGEFIYVPISNYKVVDSELDLSTFRSQVMAFARLHNLQHNNESFKLYGVRKKDCSKLSATRWVSLEDYKKNLVRSFLAEKKEEFLSHLDNIIFTTQHTDSIACNYRALQNLMANGSFNKLVKNNLDENHVMSKVLDAYGKITDGKQDKDFFVVYNYLKEFDTEYFSEVVGEHKPKLYSYCDQIAKKYAMLKHFAEKMYAWHNMDKCEQEDILEYIKLCDTCVC